MWKITNNNNRFILSCFSKEIIEPLFIEIIKYKKAGSKYSTFIHFIQSNTTIDKSKKKFFSMILNRRRNGKKLYEYYEEFSKNSLSYIKKQYKLYLLQNKKLDNKKYNIKKHEVNQSLKVIFTDFFYEKFFNDEKIWGGINCKRYSRIEFHQEFCNENSLSICPYCDIDTIHNIGNRQIEHFLPKSEYPFLSMHPYNLISSCESCNKYEGKKTNYYVPIISPYNSQIGDMLKFGLDYKNEFIKIEDSTIASLNNYLKLLNLQERYKNKEIYKTIEGRAKSLYKIFYEDEIKGSVITNITFQNYLNYRRESLTFALKYVYESIKEYTNYKTNL